MACSSSFFCSAGATGSPLPDMNASNNHPASDGFALISGILSLASWQDQLDWGLRIIATLIAIAAGSVALYHRLKKRKNFSAD